MNAVKMLCIAALLVLVVGCNEKTQKAGTLPEEGRTDSKGKITQNVEQSGDETIPSATESPVTTDEEETMPGTKDNVEKEANDDYSNSDTDSWDEESWNDDESDEEIESDDEDQSDDIEDSDYDNYDY